MPFKIYGTIHDIKDKQQITEKFSKRIVWMTIPDDKHPQTVAIEFVNKMCERLDEFSIGDEVELDFTLRGKIADTKSGQCCFTSINGFNINPAPKANDKTPIKQADLSNWEKPAPEPPADKKPFDDLPF